MKTIKFIFFSFLALSLIACTGIFIFLETFDTDQYLAQITKQVSFALGRPVSIGHVGLGLSSQGITLDAGPLTIADDKDFTTQPFIKVDNVRIGLDIPYLILQHKIHITGILLQSPQFHFICSQDGLINARSLGNSSSGVVAGLKGKTIPEATSKVLIPDTHNRSELGLLKIQDASISFIDQSATLPLDIWLSNINATFDNVLFTKPFQLSFEASVRADLSQLDIKQGPWANKISGVVQFNITHLEMGASKDLNLNGDMNITGGVIKNFNIIKTVLSHTLGAFAGMEGDIDSLLGGHLKGKLGPDDTMIENAKVKFSVHDRTFFIDDFLIETNTFDLTAKGSVDQGLNTDLQTMLSLNGNISAALVDEIEGLKYLMDDNKRIAIGAQVNGVIPHLKYKPDKDFRKKSKKAFKNFLMNLL